MNAPFTAEVVGVGTSEGDAQRGIDVVDRQPQRARLDPVHVHPQTWRLFLTLRPHAGQHFAPAGCRQQLVARGQQRFGASASAVLQLEGKATSHTQGGNRRRVQDKDIGLLDGTECPHGPLHQRLCAVFHTRPLVPRQQGDKGQGMGLTLTKEAETPDKHHVLHLGQFIVIRTDLVHDPIGTRRSGAWRALHCGEHRTLVFGRNETARQAQKQQSSNDRQADEQQQKAQRSDQNGTDAPLIAVRHAVDKAVERRKNPLAQQRPLAFGRWRAQQCCTQGRRQGQRQDGRYTHRDGQGDRELSIDAAGGPRKECHG